MRNKAKRKIRLSRKYTKRIREFLHLRFREIGIFFFMFSIVYLSTGLYLGILPPKIEQVIKKLTTIQEAKAALANDVILFAAPGFSVAEWTCISCNAGDLFNQRFPLASASAGVNGGAETHIHTTTNSVDLTVSAQQKSDASAELAAQSHTHGTTGISALASSSMPLFGSLQMMQSDTPRDQSTGIPQNMIAMFDTAPSGNWIAYATMDDGLVLASGSDGINGGSDTHNHDVNASLPAASGTAGKSGGGQTGAAAGHTHAQVTATSDRSSIVPAHTSVFLGQCNNAGGCSFDGSNSVIAMFDIDNPDGTDWTELSNATEDFDNAFIEASTSYVTVQTNGGTNSHGHSDLNITSAGPSSTSATGGGTSAAGPTHTHNINVDTWSTVDDHRPPFRTVVIAKFTGSLPVSFRQQDFKWYEDDGTLDPSEVWGNPDLAENAVLTVLPLTNSTPASGSQIRIRLNITVEDANLSAGGQAFMLLYKATTDCTTLTGYTSVGASTSNEIWRYAPDNNVTNGTTLAANRISSTETAGAYVELNPTVTNPNAVTLNNEMEWDFHVQNNGAADNTTYCFKVEKSDDTDLEAYESDSFPKIETVPTTGDLMRHGNFFLDESEKGFFWAN